MSYKVTYTKSRLNLSSLRNSISSCFHAFFAFFNNIRYGRLLACQPAKTKKQHRDHLAQHADDKDGGGHLGVVIEQAGTMIICMESNYLKLEIKRDDYRTYHNLAPIECRPCPERNQKALVQECSQPI